MYFKLPKESKDLMVEKIKDYFYSERSEEIGNLAAENLSEFISKEIAPHYYNQGVKDAKDVCEQKLVNLDEDILSLQRPIRNR